MEDAQAITVNKEFVIEPGDVYSGILNTLLYFDVFSYPLTSEEIWQNLLFAKGSRSSVSDAIKELISQGIIFQVGPFYSVRNTKELASRRIKGNIKAVRFGKLARFSARLISGFPFVRGIAFSGSLSKGYIGDDGDADFFIITAKNRLWICRTILILFKKIFLLNSKKFFCLNYFVDEDSLEIKDKNVFTAAELVHLVPVYNNALVCSMVEKNLWTRDYFMQRDSLSEPFKPIKSINIIKPVAEFAFSGPVGYLVDSFFLKLTLNRWKKKFALVGSPEFETNFRSTSSVSKHHPSGFQFKVTFSFEERVRAFELKHGIRLK